MGVFMGATLLIGGVVLLSGCSNGSSGDPEAAAQTFVDAANASDVPAAAKVVCAGDQSELRTDQSSIAFTSTLENVSVDGDSGSFTLLAEDPASGDQLRITLKLVTEDGQWRVCGLRSPQVQPVP